MLNLVLSIMKDKNDFDNIFKKLKNESRLSSKSVSKNRSNTRKIVVKWYKNIFESFDTDMIDSYRDIYVNEIDNINFEFHDLA
jgi:hypothetical protein